MPDKLYDLFVGTCPTCGKPTYIREASLTKRGFTPPRSWDPGLPAIEFNWCEECPEKETHDA